MRVRTLIVWFVVLLPALVAAEPADGPGAEVTRLRCEYLTGPLAVETASPRLSWELQTLNLEWQQVQQEAYQIWVAASPAQLSRGEGTLWNSGKVLSSETNQIVYKGKPLLSGQDCYWKVRVWLKGKPATVISGTAYWKMGLLRPSDWKASWIGSPPDSRQEAYRRELAAFSAKKEAGGNPPRPPVVPSPMLRKTFEAGSGIRSAILYVSALGYYQVQINGEKAGDQILAPEWTDYHKRVPYQAYDVARYLKPGTNALSALLADGWYLGRLGPTKWHNDYPRRGVYGNDRRLLAQLVIRYKDGRTQTVYSDSTWKINPDGFILSADNFLGQTIDLRKQPKNWMDADYDDSWWPTAYQDKTVKTVPEAQKHEPVRVHTVLKPVNVLAIGQKYVLDFGQNLTGYIRLRLQGNRGTEVVVRHGEMLNADSTLYTENLASAIQEEHYILSGGQDVFEPFFTYHGFRYAEITGLTAPPDTSTLEALAIASDAPLAGTFECSNPLLNQLWNNILWTQRNNMTSVPTDCPQRDERMGWMGDAQVFCQNSIFNMDMAAFYGKFIRDIRDAQATRGAFPDIVPHPDSPDTRFSNAPAWADAGVIIPWRMYENYGDLRVLREHYPAMRRYVENIRRQNPDGLWVKDRGNDYGDWLNGNTIKAEGYPANRGEVDKTVFATAFYANSVRLLSKTAMLLGNKKEAAQYDSLFNIVRTQFNAAFVDDSARIKSHTQSAYALALHFGLLPPEKEPAAFEHLLSCLKEYDNRISTGFITTLMMMKELTARGRNDLAYSMLESERMPSWLYSINQGATTIWERWDGFVKGRGFQDPGMNSFCHYAIGSVGEWMYRVILGIRPVDGKPGFRHVVIRPQPGGTVKWARGSYHSIRGDIGVAWSKHPEIFRLHVSIPANTTADVVVPVTGRSRVSVNSKDLGYDYTQDSSTGSRKIKLGSGMYSIEVVEQRISR